MEWGFFRLDEIADIRAGGTPSRSNPDYWENGDIPWVKISDMKEHYITDVEERITDKGLQNSSAKLFPEGTILFSIFASVGEVALLGLPATTNQAIAGIIPHTQLIDRVFLYYYLKSQKRQVCKKGRGVAQNNINLSILRSWPVPVPPLETQKRIADVLDRTQELIDKRKHQIRMLDEFLQSVFLDMFGDPGVNPRNWFIRPFSYFAKIDTRMVKDFQEYWEMPHIGVGNIESDSGRLIGYKLVKDAGLTSGKYVFDDSHIIYSKIRPNLNKVALPEFSGLCSADAYPLLVDERHTNRYFFAHILRSDYFLDYILRHSSRTNIPKVNKRQLQSFRCICPPLRLQDEFANSVVRTEEQRKVLLKSLAEMENAFNSIMQRAFKGELFN